MAAGKPRELTSGEETTAEHSLDELARGLADGSISRRMALRLMSAALVGMVIASVPGIAWAKPKLGKGPCKGPGLRKCQGSCVDTLSDPQNCGACGTVCQTGETCQNGRCAQSVPPPQVLCSPITCPLCHEDPTPGCPGAEGNECGFGVSDVCVCLNTPEGTCACVESLPCSTLSSCSSTAECQPGESCAAACGGMVCLRNCVTFVDPTP